MRRPRQDRPGWDGSNAGPVSTSANTFRRKEAHILRPAIFQDFKMLLFQIVHWLPLLVRDDGSQLYQLRLELDWAFLPLGFGLRLSRRPRKGQWLEEQCRAAAKAERGSGQLVRAGGRRRFRQPLIHLTINA